MKKEYTHMEETKHSELHEYVRRLENEVIRLRKENRTLRQQLRTSQTPQSNGVRDTGEFLRNTSRPSGVMGTRTYTQQGTPMRDLLDPDETPTPSHEYLHTTTPYDTPVPGTLRTPREVTRPAPVHTNSPLGAPLQPSATSMPQATEDGGFDISFMNYAGEADLHTLPYGLVILDRQGHVLFYNETESRLTGFQRARVEGKNFFQDIAPCTRIKAFEGRFRDFIANKLGPVVFFDFVFRFENGNQFVTIGFSKGRKRGTVNVMMRRRAV